MTKKGERVKKFLLRLKTEGGFHYLVHLFENQHELSEALGKKKLKAEWYDDGVAFTNCYKKGRKIADVYLCRDFIDGGTIAHEMTHMSLSVLARLGYKKIPITTEEAPPLEEALATFVGEYTEQILEALNKV